MKTSDLENDQDAVPAEGLFRSPVVREFVSRNEPRLKARVIATLVVRGNALAMLIVGLVRVFDCLYTLYDPVFAPRLESPAARRYTVAVLLFDFGLSLLLFILSRRIGGLFARDLDAPEHRPDEPTLTHD